MTLDFNDVKTAEELHELLRVQLRFPEYYGRNFDALWDCIRDPEQSNIPPLLEITGLSALALVLPREAQLLRECLEELPFERPDIEVHIT